MAIYIIIALFEQYLQLEMNCKSKNEQKRKGIEAKSYINFENPGVFKKCKQFQLVKV